MEIKLNTYCESIKGEPVYILGLGKLAGWIKVKYINSDKKDEMLAERLFPIGTKINQLKLQTDTLVTHIENMRSAMIDSGGFTAESIMIKSIDLVIKNNK